MKHAEFFPGKNCLHPTKNIFSSLESWILCQRLYSKWPSSSEPKSDAKLSFWLNQMESSETKNFISIWTCKSNKYMIVYIVHDVCNSCKGQVHVYQGCTSNGQRVIVNRKVTQTLIFRPNSKSYTMKSSTTWIPSINFIQISINCFWCMCNTTETSDTTEKSTF